jgi:hypothetical protein
MRIQNQRVRAIRRPIKGALKMAFVSSLARPLAFLIRHLAINLPLARILKMPFPTDVTSSGRRLEVPPPRIKIKIGPNKDASRILANHTCDNPRLRRF